MINILPPEVYNRIAAGEVVDRPYSVVKELVENAIDAGATEITVEAEGGGKKLIRVTDNGCGHPQGGSQSRLPAARDEQVEDGGRPCRHLHAGLPRRGGRLRRLRFQDDHPLPRRRGRRRTRSPWRGASSAKSPPQAARRGPSSPFGILFYNTPARLKFLKGDAGEEGDITAMMARFLLSRPEISFTYLVNGKVRYRSFGDGLESALAVVYGAGPPFRTASPSAPKSTGCASGGTSATAPTTSPTEAIRASF